MYGDPPKMALFDERGRKVSHAFELTASNLLSFQNALRRALAAFLGTHLEVAGAELVRLKDAETFVRVVKSGHYSHVIYYGHAIKELNILLPALGQNLTPSRMAQALKESSVEHFDILGYEGATIAAELSPQVPKIRVGYLPAKREDDVDVDVATLRVRSLTIQPQTIQHFGGGHR